jgi:hypothetical protein
MCVIDLEPCAVWRETRRKARKEHRCSCCLRTIRAGEGYLAHFSVYDGDATSEKCCVDCERDRKAFAVAHDGMLCTPGNLAWMLVDCIGDEPETEARWGPLLTRIEASRKANR